MPPPPAESCRWCRGRSHHWLLVVFPGAPLGYLEDLHTGAIGQLCPECRKLKAANPLCETCWGEGWTDRALAFRCLPEGIVVVARSPSEATREYTREFDRVPRGVRRVEVLGACRSCRRPVFGDEAFEPEARGVGRACEACVKARESARKGRACG